MRPVASRFEHVVGKERYVYVATVHSMSDPDKEYTLKTDAATGQLTCNCPAWIFNHGGDRVCKHIAYYNANRDKLKPLAAPKKPLAKNVKVVDRFLLLEVD